MLYVLECVDADDGYRSAAPQQVTLNLPTVPRMVKLNQVVLIPDATIGATRHGEKAGGPAPAVEQGP